MKLVIMAAGTLWFSDWAQQPMLNLENTAEAVWKRRV